MIKKSGKKEKAPSRKRRRASKKGKQSTRKGRVAEEIIARLYNAPRLSVERNAKLAPLNRSSRLKREIDVLLSSRIVSKPSERTAIESKNLSKKVNVEKIDAFVGKLLDVGIPHDHGIYVSTSGYTRDAIDRAIPAGIKLLTLTGLTEDRLDSIRTPASQFCVFYLAQLTGFTITNNVSVVTKTEELICFYDEKGEPCGHSLGFDLESVAGRRTKVRGRGIQTLPSDAKGMAPNHRREERTCSRYYRDGSGTGARCEVHRVEYKSRSDKCSEGCV